MFANGFTKKLFGYLILRLKISIFPATDPILLFVLRKFAQRLILTYDSSLKKDGTGAQAQRVMGVYALSRLTGLRYRHSQIEDIAVHPLDPFQTPDEYQQFLFDLNLIFELPSDPEKTSKNLVKNCVGRAGLVHAFLLSIATRKNVLIKISEPFFLVDRYPEYYLLAAKIIRPRFSNKMEKSTKKVVLHYRRGVGGMVIQNGESTPRELAEEFYFDAIHLLFQINPQSASWNLRVLTDSPANNLTFIPPASQVGLWDGSPKFENGEMKVSGYDFNKITYLFSGETTVVRGGNPIDAIREMVNSEALIISKSSLSYVAALIKSEGIILYPSTFWHPALNSWTIVADKYIPKKHLL